MSELATAPIILVPGFWLGAWAWDEVASLLRADGHDVTALTLPGLESKDADRSSITLQRPRRRDLRAVKSANAPVVLAVHSATGFSRLRRQRPGPGADRGDGLRRHRAGQGRARSGVRGRREADGVGGDPGRGEPRRADRRAARHLPRAGRPRAGRPDPGGARVHQRRPPRHPVARSSRPATPPRPTSSTPGRTRCRRSSPACPSCANITWIDLPTSHWPMWSRPADIAAIIGDVARGASPALTELASRA